MSRIIKLLSIFTIFLISTFYFLSSGRVYADTPCQPIYGGGQTCTITPTPTVTIKGGYQTVLPKGGFPVLSPVPVYTTPSTGSEALVLFSLVPTGIAGWLLRKYSTKRKPKQRPCL